MLDIMRPSCVTRDEVKGYPDNPQKFNLYVYALNNPILFKDPSGYSVYDQWKTLTIKEQALVKSHPIEAYYVNKARNIAWAETERRFKKYYNDGVGNHGDDKSDAFRHAYWNALMSKYIGEVVPWHVQMPTSMGTLVQVLTWIIIITIKEELSG